MTVNRETVATTKEPERLPFHWPRLATRVKDLGLPNLKLQAPSDAEFKALGETMTKSRKPGEWEWQLDWDAFEFEIHLTIGSSRTTFARAKMNTLDVKERGPVLDSLRARTGLVTQGEIDKYFAVARKRAEKSAEIVKIDKAIEQETISIDAMRDFLGSMPKSVEALDRGQREMDLKPVADKLGLGGYVEFVYGLDSGWSPYPLMKKHFDVKPDRPLRAFPPAIAEKLRREFGPDEKGKPDFAPARKIAVGVIDARVMPAWRREKTSSYTLEMRKSALKIRKLQEQRSRALGAR